MFDVRTLYEKYCKKESGEKYYCEKDSHTYEIVPAKETELDAFKVHCETNNIPKDVIEDLSAYYKQNNNFFNYYSCDDLGIFEWWDDYKELWLGCVDMDVFRYSSDLGKYTIGDVGNVSYSELCEFDTIEEMLIAHFEGIEM